MTVRSELETGLVGASGIGILGILQAGTSAFNQLATGNVYWDSRTRVQRAEKEVLLSWGGRLLVGAATGRLFSSKVAIELFLATNDSVHAAATRYDEALEQAAQELVEALDHKETLFESALTARINAIRCYESSAVDILFPDPQDARLRYTQTLMLEVTAWET